MLHGFTAAKAFAVANIAVSGAATKGAVGGFVGNGAATSNDNTIQQCYSWLAMSVGGLAGAIFNISITECIAYGVITALKEDIVSGLLAGSLIATYHHRFLWPPDAAWRVFSLWHLYAISSFLGKVTCLCCRGTVPSAPTRISALSPPFSTRSGFYRALTSGKRFCSTPFMPTAASHTRSRLCRGQGPRSTTLSS